MNDRLNSRNTQLDRLSLALAVFKHYVEIKNYAQLYDNNRLAESLMADLMSCLCGWGNFKDLNKEKRDHCAIDLLSDDGTVGVQVTATRTTAKVKETLKNFASLPNKPQQLYLLMICGRQKTYACDSLAQSIELAGIPFDPKSHILDLKSLFRIAQNNDQARLEEAVQRLEKEMGPRALTMLGNYNKNADRVLQVLHAHDLRRSEFNELLDIDPKQAPTDIATAHGLQPWLTPAISTAIADQFNVSLDWLDGTDDRTGDYYNSSSWRTTGDVAGLLANVAERYGHAHFYIVIPDDLDNPFEHFEQTRQGSWDVPFLVFYKARGTYGDVFAHLGVQPWNTLHHRQAALFLSTALRDFSRQGFGHFCVTWEQWSRDNIMASCTDKLLAELMQYRIGLSLEGQDCIHFDGHWQFPGQPELTTRFNGDYLPSVLHGFQHLQQMHNQSRVLQEYIDTQAAWHSIAAPAPGAKRINGYQACDIAQLCQTPLRCSDAHGHECELSVGQARALIDEQLEMAAADPRKRFVFLDIQVEPTATINTR
ncbi:SMEK domain-containing protein [Pseudomonas pergaminensis]